MNKEVEWKIFYENFEFRSLDGKVEEAPPFGVICIVGRDNEIGRYILHRWDWYYFKDNEWWGCDIHGLLDQVTHYAQRIIAVKQGRTIKTDKFKQILKRAEQDSDFPNKIELTYKEKAQQTYGEGVKK